MIFGLEIQSTLETFKEAPKLNWSTTNKKFEKYCEKNLQKYFLTKKFNFAELIKFITTFSNDDSIYRITSHSVERIKKENVMFNDLVVAIYTFVIEETFL